MEKEFILYEEALLMKELGFNEKCLAVYQYPSQSLVRVDVNSNGITNSILVNFVSAPLWQQAFRFFRKKYPDIDFGIGRIHKETDNYHFHINYEWEFFVGTYEEAELACLRKLIEIVTTK